MKLQKFYEWLKLNKNSQETIDSYYRQVNYFGRFCDYKFNQENLNKYLIKLKDENKSKNTINLFKNAISCYCQYVNIKLNIPSPKAVKRKEIKFYFTEEDITNILKTCYDETDLLLRFMFYTGARSSEVLNLKINNIDFKKKNVKFCRAKGDKDRIIPCLNTKLFEDLHTHCLAQQEKVFTFSYGQLKYLFKKIKKDLQINEEEIVEPRTMRISFAKNCVSKGMNILVLKKLMGHTNIKVTEMYAEPDEKIIKEVCEEIRTGKKENNPKDKKIIEDLKNIIESLKKKLKG